MVVKIQKVGRSFMPMPNHCIECDKVATLLDIDVPYCSKCYKEIVYAKRKSSKKTFKTV